MAWSEATTMQRRAQAIATLLAVLIALPVSAASWGGRGFYEPDTQLDVDEGFMYLVPDQSSDTGVRQVYFSIYSGFYVATANANSAVVGSSVMNYPSNVHAFLGVWKDCNGDGYIGTIEGGLLEYRSTLLLGKTICPEVRGLDVHAPGYFPTHNDGEWVREFLWIGPDYILSSTTETGCYHTPTTRECTRRENATNPFNIADEGARIWADFGLPDDAPKASCPVNPRPRGTYQSTGGFLRYVDCFSNWKITGSVNDADNQNDLSGTLGVRIGFDDAAYNRPDKSGSVLNQKNPYGQESDKSYASAWDCSAESRILVKDETGPAPSTPVTHQSGAKKGVKITSPLTSTLADIYVNYTDDGGYYYPHSSAQGPHPDLLHGINRPGVPTFDPTGSPAGTVNHTLEGAAGDCDGRTGMGTNSDVYSIDEDDFEASPLQRVRTDIMYTFFEGTRAHDEDGVEKELNGVLGQGTPQDDFGVGVAPTFSGTPAWFGSPGYVVSRNPYVNRDNLQPWGAVYMTAYAKVTRTDIQTAGGSGTYGSTHCAGATPLTGSFECNVNKWYPLPVPKPGQVTGRNQWHAVVGDTYNLKDTDCWDAGPTKYAPNVAPSLLTEKQCERPTPPDAVADAAALVNWATS